MSSGSTAAHRPARRHRIPPGPLKFSCLPPLPFSGLSEKARDPALTVPQILVGLAFADWGFLICGPGRAIALLPMLLVMVFGAFSLHWRKMAALTGLALGGFAMSLAGQQWLRHLHGDPQRPLELRQDLIYLSILVVVMPAAAGLSAQLSRLRSRLRAERAALALALANVQRLAAFDELTGLANRRHAHDYLAMAQARAYRDGASFAVVLIDLDHFKRINDTQGHGAGDKVLRAFAEASRAMLRPSDMMARWGGEEFLIVMPGTSAADAHAATTRLLQAVHALPTDSGHLLSFSAGVAEWKAGETFTMTMTRADGAMYAAKHAGRDQVRLAG